MGYTDIQKVSISDTAPSTDTLWINTGETPPRMRYWNGTGWAEVKTAGQSSSSIITPT